MIGISFGLGAGSAAAARVGSRLRSGVQWVRAVLRAMAHRRQVMRLMELDDRCLKDIGLLRTDVIGALEEPPHRDPSTLLRLRAVKRRAYRDVMDVSVPPVAKAQLPARPGARPGRARSA